MFFAKNYMSIRNIKNMTYVLLAVSLFVVFFKTFAYATNQIAIEGKVKGVDYTEASTGGVP